MMEVTQFSQDAFDKRVGAYLEGSLSLKERSEFEAFVALNPQFKKKIEEKEFELEKLRQKIPTIVMSKNSREVLDSEIKESVFNLLRQTERSNLQKLKDFFEEKFSR